MKKVLLSLAFVLAIGSSAMKATNSDNSQDEPISCTRLAMELQGEYEDLGINMETANLLATVGYYVCVNNGGHPTL